MVISQIMGDAQSQLGHGPEPLAVRFLSWVQMSNAKNGLVGVGEWDDD